MSGYENRLWAHLVDVHGAEHVTSMPRRTVLHRGWLMRRPVAASAGVVVLAAGIAATIVLLLGATATTQPAYALTKNPDGSVTVSVRNLQTAIGPLNARFAAFGIPERIIPIEKACQRPGFAVYPIKPSELNLPWTFTVRKSRKWLAPGEEGYMAIGRSDSGQLLYAQGAMKPPLPTCFRNVVTEPVIPGNS